jgi:hypothetical protein
MGASNHPQLRFPKGRAHALDAEDDARAIDRHQRRVYKHVDLRDQKQCTCCGRTGNPDAKTTLGKLHHEHIVELSLGGETTPENVCLLCWVCHPFKTAHQLDPHGNPEKAPLTYTVTAKAAAEIFKGRRRPAHVRVVEGT